MEFRAQLLRLSCCYQQYNRFWPTTGVRTIALHPVFTGYHLYFSSSEYTSVSLQKSYDVTAIFEEIIRDRFWQVLDVTISRSMHKIHICEVFHASKRN